jgi:hypothetical protein
MILAEMGESDAADAAAARGAVELFKRTDALVQIADALSVHASVLGESGRLLERKTALEAYSSDSLMVATNAFLPAGSTSLRRVNSLRFHGVAAMAATPPRSPHALQLRPATTEPSQCRTDSGRSQADEAFQAGLSRLQTSVLRILEGVE